MRNNFFMLKSIEHRILFSLIIIGLVPLSISFIFSNSIIAKSFLRLEKETVHTLGKQANMIIEEKLNEMDMVTKDYSVWDETYEMINTKDKEWLSKNISGCIPDNYNYDLTIAINKDGEVLDEFGLISDDISPMLQIESISNILVVPYNINKSVNAKGIFMYAGEPYLFCASPILMNNYKGEPRGVLIIGKRLSPSYIKEMEDRLGAALFITFGDKVVYNDKGHSNIENYIKVSKTQQSTEDFKFINNELMGSLNLVSVSDIGQAKLTVIMKRDAFIETRRFLNISSGILMWLSFFSILIIGFLLKKKTILPLKHFEKQIYKMSEYNVVSYVETDGPEEIERLTEAFNKMVLRINEQKIENQNLRCELEYDRLQSEFLTNVSHEFRTPLNIILGTVQLLELLLKKEHNAIMSKVIDKYVHVMRQNCYRLTRLINNLIDLTRIRSNAYKIHLKNCNIISLVEDISLSVTEYAESKGISICFDTDTEEKIMACDSEQIQRIILNLLSNSIKFTKTGGEIWVTIQDKIDTVLITIKDTGIGIPEDQLHQIFKRFMQVDKTLTRSHEGIGIGLSLVKSLVEMHKGTIHVKSEYGKGSEFIIELPVTIIPDLEEVDEKYNFVPKDNVERMHIEFSDFML